MDCTRCDLYKYTYSPCIQGKGKKTSKVFFIGQSPGQEEEKQKRPFVGPAGVHLTLLIEKAGKNAKDCFISNAVKCFPVTGRKPINELSPTQLAMIKQAKSKNYRAPYVKEIKACVKHLLKELEEIKPRLIICLGNEAMYPFLGKKTGIKKEHGRIIKTKWGYVIFTFHPSAAIQDPTGEISKIIVDDFKKAFSLLEKPIVYDNTKIFSYKTKDEIDTFLNILKKQKIYSMDIETNSLTPFQDDAKILCISFSWRKDEGHVILLSDISIFNKLKQVLELDAMRIGNNVKFDALFLREIYGINTTFFFDNMIAHKLLYPDAISHGLKEMAKIHTAMGDYSNGIDQSNLEDLEEEKLLKYSAQDADASFRMFKILDPQIRNECLYNVFKLSMSVSNMLVDIESAGLSVDVKRLWVLKGEYEGELKNLRNEILNQEDIKNLDLGEIEFNPNSHPNLKKLFLDHLRLKPVKVSKQTGEPSFDKEALLEIKHPLASKIIRYRRLTKMLSTYIENLFRAIYKAKYHPEFWITGESRGGTVSGRLSSSLHTFPERIEDRKIKSVFVSSFLNGYIIELDLSMIELRVAAELSGDRVMLKAIKEGRDLHKLTASQVFDVPENEVTPEQRYIGKTCTFSLIYGVSVNGLRKRLKETTEEDYTEEYVENLRNKFFDFYIDTKMHISQSRLKVKSKKSIKSIFGRKRDLSKITDINYIERFAVNFPVQATASDLAFLGTLDLHSKLSPYVSHIIGMVHDSVILDVHPDEVYQVVDIAINSLENPPIKKYFPNVDFSIPLKVGVTVGRSWGHGKELA